SRKLVFSQIKSHILAIAISEFEAKLSIFVGKHVERIKGCLVRLISSGKPYCSSSATATATGDLFQVEVLRDSYFFRWVFHVQIGVK
ncbi:hypothetical protein R6Q57_020939, partial [Mikania cordata]